jgi:hypothetical protein
MKKAANKNAPKPDKQKKELADLKKRPKAYLTQMMTNKHPDRA